MSFQEGIDSDTAAFRNFHKMYLMLGNDSRPKSFLGAVLFVRPMTNLGRQETIGVIRDASFTGAGLNSSAPRFLVA